RSADGVTWEETAKEIIPHVGVRGNAVFNGSLYLGTNGPPTIWKTDDGENWELVFEPTPDIRHGYAGSLAVFKGMLYAGIHTHSDPRNDLFRTADGVHWETVGEISPHTIESMAPFGEFLYAGSLFPPLAQIYRSSGLNPSSIHTAEGEISARAERTGSYLDTQTAYNLPETLRPIPKNSGWDMEHTWRFSINAGELLTLGVKASALKTDSSAALLPGEAYLFSYSRDGKKFTPFLKVEKDTEKEENSFPYSLTTIKDVTGGELFIRVTGNFKMKSDIKSSLPPPALHVDHLFLISEGKPKTRKRS
ncbi:MAG TPA: hypothetical protein VLB09_05415, partial [Nitrospiria bacterium]|nr:hypothetical protein [Nitrospiria bacterium]